MVKAGADEEDKKGGKKRKIAIEDGSAGSTPKVKAKAKSKSKSKSKGKAKAKPKAKAKGKSKRNAEPTESWLDNEGGESEEAEGQEDEEEECVHSVSDSEVTLA
jgi:hypothetical protein